MTRPKTGWFSAIVAALAIVVGGCGGGTGTARPVPEEIAQPTNDAGKSSAEE